MAFREDRYNNPSRFHRPDHIKDPLYVITPIFNPHRYRARWKHYNNFEHHALDSGAVLVTVECSFGNRADVIIEEKGKNHIIIHLQSEHELWLKENLFNIAVQHLSIIRPDWKYVAMVDADITFGRPDWVGECLQKLQHFPIVQMFSQVAYLGPDGTILHTSMGFMEGWRRGIPFKNKNGQVQDESFFLPKHPQYPCPRIGWAGAPGGAWAYRRSALDMLGGLIDCAILGSADYHMATALMGFLHVSMGSGGTSNSNQYHPDYIAYLLRWQDRAIRCIKRNVGHMSGTIFHHWHGKTKDRGYDTRWKILVRHGFNPNTDLVRATNGLWQLDDQKWQLRDDIRAYFSLRNEDSIDV